MMIMIAFALAVAAQAAPAGSENAPARDATSPAKVCKKPELRDRMSVPSEDLQNLAEAVQSYVDCMGPVIETSRTRAQNLMEQAKKEAEANNAAVTEVNDLIAAYRAFEAKHRNDK